MSNSWLGILTLLALVTSACSEVQPLPDGPLQLAPGQGLAAVVMDAPGPVLGIEYAAKSKDGTDFAVPDTRGDGLALALVPVTAGRYCLRHFVFDNNAFEPSQELGCLTVLPGHITYGGHIVPESGADGSITDQQFRPTEFLAALHRQYPKLAAAYPVAAASGPPAGVQATPDTQELSTWIQDIPDTRSQAIYIQNDTGWAMHLTRIRIYLCSNVEQTCGLHPMDVVLAPFETRQVLELSPADPAANYAYRYDFNYERVD